MSPVRQRRGRSYVLAAALALVAGLTVAPMPAEAAAEAPVLVPADGETTPVAHPGDAADDVAIWVDTGDPARSLLIGNDKKGALEVYGLDGVLRQRITSSTALWGNVDVRQGVTVAGVTRDLVVVPNDGLRLFAVDPASRTLASVTESPGAVPTGGGAGGCLYRSPAGALYAFVITKAGRVREFLVTDADRDGLLSASQVRQFSVGSNAEACVVDDATGSLYIAAETVGVWRYGADPAAGTARTSIDTIKDGHLVGDVEGLTIARSGARSWLLASAQSSAAPTQSYVVVYDRPTGAYQSSFRVVAGSDADGCEGTDGIAAYAGALGPAFPSGVFVCQDNTNTGPKARQDFKLVRLEKVLPLG